MLLVPGPHFEKHRAHKHSQTQGGCMLSHSINHTLHLSAKEAISCGRVRRGFAEEPAFMQASEDGRFS